MITNTDRLEPLSEQQKDRLAGVLDEYLGQLEQGVAPDDDALFRQYPDLAGSLRHYLSSVNLLHQASVGHSEHRPKTNLGDGDNRLGDYQLLREIGRGGMGIVFEARQISLDRPVAVKILPFAAALNAKQIARFQNEARAAAQLHHSNIVPVYAVGNDRGTYFYSMQLIPGVSLEQVIGDLKSNHEQSLHTIRPRAAGHSKPGALAGRLRDFPSSSKGNDDPASAEWAAGKATASTRRQAATRESINHPNHVRRVVELGLQAADALHFAHEQGIVHRDIKPSNLLVDSTGQLWVTDFGLAQCASFVNLTGSGDLLGTLRYMSPEQAAGRTQCIDHRTDIYSLCATLSEVLTLQPLIDGADRPEMLRQLESDRRPSLRGVNPAIMPDLENILLKGMSHDREDRYATAEDLAADLRRYLEGRTPLARRPTLFDKAERLIRRRAKTVAVAIGLLMAGLVGLACLSSWMAAKNRAIAQANARSLAHLETANEVLDRFGAQLINQLDEFPGTEALQRKVLNESLGWLQSFTVYSEHLPELQAERGRVLLKLAGLQEMAGLHQQALKSYGQAETLLTQRLDAGRFATSSEDLLTTYNNAACLLVRLGQHADAELRLTRAIDLLEHGPSDEAALGLGLDAVPQRLWLSLLRLNLGHSLAKRKELEKARDEFAAAVLLLDTPKPPRSVPDLRSLRSKSGTDPFSSPTIRRRLVAALIQTSEMESTPPDTSKTLLDKALGILAAIPPQSTINFHDSHQLCLCQLAMGSTECRSRHSAESITWYQKAVAGLAALSKQHLGDFDLFMEHAAALNNLGQAHLAADDRESALVAIELARDLLETKLGELSDLDSSGLLKSSLGGVLHNLAAIAVSEGRTEKAVQLLNQAIEQQTSARVAMPGNLRTEDLLKLHRTLLESIAKTTSHRITKPEAGN